MRYAERYMDQYAEKIKYGLADTHSSLPEDPLQAKKRSERIEYYLNLGKGLKDGSITLEQFAEEQAEKDLQRESESERDDLTGLLNRRGFFNAFEVKLLGFKRALYESEQHPSDHQLQKKVFGSLVFLDLDSFGLVNKKKGEYFGDALLQQIAFVLGESFRPTDLVSRFGGEEIAIFLEGASLEDASKAIEKFRETFPDRLIEKMKTALPKDMDKIADLHQTACFGIMQFPESLSSKALVDPENRTTLFRETHKGAVDAMRFAKHQPGKNCTAINHSDGRLEVIAPLHTQSTPTLQ